MDWIEWHSAYDDPASSLSRRLDAVRAALARALAARRGEPTQIVSICAGDGRDTLPVVAAGDRGARCVLIELDPRLAAAARDEADRLGLDSVEVREADAGAIDSFAGIARADVFMACGVFGNVTDADLDRTVRTLPQLLAPGATVIWTRGTPTVDPTERAGDPADLVREVFGRHGYVEDAFERPPDADYRVGAHRFVGAAEEPVPGAVMFRFTR
jgi:hypothetical protein